MIVKAIEACTRSEERDMLLTPSQENRLTPEAYHARMAEALIGVSWNGAVNFDSNRFAESFAHGLCLVSETPRIQMPHPYENMKHAIFVKHPEQVAPMVRVLLDDPAAAVRIAVTGHQHFLTYHCAAARARYILACLGFTADAPST